MIQKIFTPKLFTQTIVLALLTIFVLNDTFSFHTTQSAKSVQASQYVEQTQSSLQCPTPPYDNE